MSPLLSINNLFISFRSGDTVTAAVKNMSITVHPGEIVALVGESGSGKSVTSLSILRLVPSPPAVYEQGEILFQQRNGQTIDLLKADSKSLQGIRGNQIAMIFQEPMSSLNPVHTCGRQVVEAIRAHKKISYTEAKQQTIEWFERVKLPNPSAIFSRFPHQLSGGQKQRVMIAMAMCCKPSLLICDEPTTALDVTVQKTILQLIKELQHETGMGVIFITHDLGVVAEIADRAAVMYKGEIVETGSTQQLFQRPAHPYTKALLACRPVNHPKGKRLPVVADFMQVSTTNINSSTTAAQQIVSDYNAEEKLIEVKNLSVWFPTKKNFLGKSIAYTKAVDDVSFDVWKGETLGLVGESGCGKTTLGRTMLNLVEATKGTVLYLGEDLLKKNKNDWKALRKDIQIIFQDPYSSLNPRLTIGSAIGEPLTVHDGLKKEEREEAVSNLLEKVNLLPVHAHRYPHEFSGGQRQRIVIARALSLKPSFIVCDESVSALDVSVQAQVLNLLNDLKKEYGFTIIFISHDLSVVRYISDRIMVMNKGKIEEIGEADSIYFNPQSDYTKKLIASIPKGISTDAA